MTRDEFCELVLRFKARPTVPAAGERHVYLWRGPLQELEACLPHGVALRLDLHSLARTLEEKPAGMDGARRCLERGVELWLRAHPATGGAQQVVVVSGCDLLMRYRVSLGALFQAAGDSLMVIFAAPPYAAPLQPLPSYVEFQPAATFQYVSSRLPEAAVIQ